MVLKYYPACFLFILPAVWGACTKEGVFCTADCKGIQLCTLIGENPIKFIDCDIQNEGYCIEYNEDGLSKAICGSPAAECNALTSRELSCGSFGEFPHPIFGDRTIRCGGIGENVKPLQGLLCPAGEFIDPTTIPLTCTKSLNMGYPVDCRSEESRIGPYCYTCTSDRIIAYMGCEVLSIAGFLPSAPFPSSSTTYIPTDTTYTFTPTTYTPTPTTPNATTYTPTDTTYTPTDTTYTPTATTYTPTPTTPNAMTYTPTNTTYTSTPTTQIPTATTYKN